MFILEEYYLQFAPLAPYTVHLSFEPIQLNLLTLVYMFLIWSPV